MKLLNNERDPFTDFIPLTYVDLQAIGTGGTRQIALIPAGGAVALAVAIKSAAFTGSTTTVINIGTTIGDPDEFIDNLNISTSTLNLPVSNTGDLMVQAAGTTTFLGGNKLTSLVAVDTPIYIKVTDAAIASLTAGELVIGLQVVDLLKYRL